MDFTEALHIVSGDSAAGTLKFALHLRRDRVLINEDPVSVGPAPFSGDLAAWRSAREQFLVRLHAEWPDFSLDHFSDNGLLANASRLAEPGDKVIWAGAGLPDQLTAAWMHAANPVVDTRLRSGTGLSFSSTSAADRVGLSLLTDFQLCLCPSEVDL